MSQVYVPEGYNTVMPYLIIDNADGFLRFTQAVFGAQEKMKVMRDETTIMHAEITIGESCIMFAGANDQFSVQTAGLYVNVADVDTTYRIALEHGATSIMEPTDQEYGRSCGVKDPSGNTWWITSTPRS